MALRDKVLRRTFAILELPLAVVDTTLDHKIGAVGTARDFLAAQVRRLDRKMGVGPDAEPVSHFEAEAPQEAPATAPAPVKEAKEALERADAAAAMVAETVKEEVKEVIAEAKATDTEASPKSDAPEESVVKESGISTLPKVPKKTGTQPPKAPFADYDKLNVHKVSRHVRSADLDLLAAVEAYEAANKNRKTILNAIETRRERLANS